MTASRTKRTYTVVDVFATSLLGDPVAVVLDAEGLDNEREQVIAGNLLYAAVTRGKRPVIIVGQRRALAIAVRTINAGKRWTKLVEWMLAHANDR